MKLVKHFTKSVIWMWVLFECYLSWKAIGQIGNVVSYQTSFKGIEFIDNPNKILQYLLDYLIHSISSNKAWNIFVKSIIILEKCLPSQQSCVKYSCQSNNHMWNTCVKPTILREIFICVKSIIIRRQFCQSNKKDCESDRKFMQS